MITINKFETGASTHAVNDLILFTDNTRELAQHRDFIYKRNLEKSSNNLSQDFEELHTIAQNAYVKEFGKVNSKHVLNIKIYEIWEYCSLYAADFNDWKLEHGYKQLNVSTK